MPPGERSVVFGMEIDLAKLRTGLGQSLGLVRGTVGQIERSFRTLSNPFAALGLAAAGTGLALMVKGALEIGDSLDEMSSRIGVGVVKLQELQHAAKVSGASAEELETGLKFLNKGLGEAAAGDQKAIQLFRDLGISITDAAGGMRDAGTVINDVADRIAAIESPAERTRLILQLFGRAGTALIPMLEGGSAGLENFAAAAHRLGLVLNQDMIKEAGRAKDELDTLATAIKINLTRAVLTFSPHLLEMAAKLNSFAGSVKAIVESMGDAKFAGVEELTKRIDHLSRRIENLKTQVTGEGGNLFERLGGKLNRFFGHGDSLKRELEGLRQQQAELDKLRTKRAAGEVAKKASAPLVSQEQLDNIEKLRQKVLDAAIPDPVVQSIVKFRLEVEKLASETPTKAGEIRALGKAFEDIRAGAEAAKRAITDTQAATLAKSLGLPETNIFAGFDEIDKIKTEADQFGQAIQGLVSRGVPLSQAFELIGKTQDALSLKTANLREKFAQQPVVLEQIRKELAGVDFGAFQRSQDALARSFTGVSQGAAIVEDAMGKVDVVFGTAITKFGDAGQASNFLAGVLFTDMPAAASATVGSFVVLTGQTHLLAQALAEAHRWATLLATQVGVGGQVAVPAPGNFQ